MSLTLPPDEVPVLLGLSGTGKSVFLESLIGLLKPEKGSIVIHHTDLVRCNEFTLYDIRKLFGVLFQDGAPIGSMSLFGNVALRCAKTQRRARPRSATSSWRSSTWSASRATR